MRHIDTTLYALYLFVTKTKGGNLMENYYSKVRDVVLNSLREHLRTLDLLNRQEKP